MNNPGESTGNQSSQRDRDRKVGQGTMGAVGKRPSLEEARATAMRMLGKGQVGPRGEGQAKPQIKGETAQTTAEVVNKAKKNRAVKKLATGIAIGVFTGLALFAAAKSSHNGSTDPTAMESVVDDDESTADYEEMEAQGIKQGYGEKGMFLSSKKPNGVSFGSAKEALEVCGTPTEMVKYTAENQVESFSAYIPSLPPKILEKYLPEFSGLTAAETEKKLESLAAESYDKVLKTFKQIMDLAVAHEDTLPEGEYDNAFMTPIDPNAPINNQNMKLVKCTTHEDGTIVTVFEWFDDDGVSLGTMSVKTGDEDGCIQVVKGVGTIIFSDLDVVIIPQKKIVQQESEQIESESESETPPESETQPDNPPQETIQPKSQENMGRVDKKIQSDIAADTGTQQVVVTPETAASTAVTPQTESSNETAPTIVANETAPVATPVQPETSSANNVSENLGGANAGGHAPVQPDTTPSAAQVEVVEGSPEELDAIRALGIVVDENDNNNN